MLGSRQIGQTVTGADGKYSFAEVVPGIYNLVANKDGVTQTVLVTIADKAVADQTITMSILVLNLRKIQCALLRLLAFLVLWLVPQKKQPLFS